MCVATPVFYFAVRPDIVFPGALCMKNNEHLKEFQIDISMPDQLAYWSEKLCCRQDDLVEAVLKIGNSARMVDDFLILNRKKNNSGGE